MVNGSSRTLLRRLHLGIAMVFGCIFVISGLTGMALAWMHELDAWLNPDLFHVAPQSHSAMDKERPSDAATIIQQVSERLTRDPAYGTPTMLVLPEHPDGTVVAWYRSSSKPASSTALEKSRQVMVNPTTLVVTGERQWGELGLSRRLLLPTLFHLHRYLLAGETGKTIIGISGLALFAMSVTGMILWWPKWTGSGLRKAIAFTYRGRHTLADYAFHRSMGFYAALVMATLGLSGLYFNLPQWVTPVLGSFATVSSNEKLSNEPANGRTAITASSAASIAQAAFPDARVSRIILPSKSLPYEIRLRQPDELRKGDGNTRVTIDAYTARILRIRDPLRAQSGDTILNTLFPLHTGEAFGTGGRVFIMFFGVMPLIFMVSGCAIWWRRRTARSQRQQGAPAAGT